MYANLQSVPTILSWIMALFGNLTSIKQLGIIQRLQELQLHSLRSVVYLLFKGKPTREVTYYGLHLI